MEKQKNSSVWTEEGYCVFAKGGLHGLKVERLAGTLGLNTSEFYHNFRDLEGFCYALVLLHKKRVSAFLQEVAAIKKLDPDYLYLLIEHREMVMFQVHLTRNPGNNSFYAASEIVDQKVSHAVQQLWCDYLDIPLSSDLGMRYYKIVRDMFSTRVTFQSLNYTFLHDLVEDARTIMQEIGERRAFEADEPLY